MDEHGARRYNICELVTSKNEEASHYEPLTKRTLNIYTENHYMTPGTNKTCSTCQSDESSLDQNLKMSVNIAGGQGNPSMPAMRMSVDSKNDSNSGCKIQGTPSCSLSLKNNQPSITELFGQVRRLRQDLQSSKKRIIFAAILLGTVFVLGFLVFVAFNLRFQQETTRKVQLLQKEAEMIESLVLSVSILNESLQLAQAQLDEQNATTALLKADFEERIHSLDDIPEPDIAESNVISLLSNASVLQSILSSVHAQIANNFTDLRDDLNVAVTMLELMRRNVTALTQTSSDVTSLMASLQNADVRGGCRPIERTCTLARLNSVYWSRCNTAPVQVYNTVS